MKRLSLVIGLLFISSLSYAQQKVIIGEPILGTENIKKHEYMGYYKACNREFHMGIFKNVVWIRGTTPVSFCQQYARHMTKDL